MGAADLHMHSVHSDGTATISAILHHASAHTDLDVIAITDHDTLEGSLRARDLAAHFRVQVAPGIEIRTSEGHLLALFLETPVRAGLSFVETAELVRLYGGLPFAAHPTGSLAKSLGAQRLRRIVRRYPGLLAGIEAENGSLPLLRDNASAQDLRWELGLPGIGNSDAHDLASIGAARTAFPGHTVADLRRALEGGYVVPLPVHWEERSLGRVAAHFALRVGFGLVDDLWVEGGEGRVGKRWWVDAGVSVA